MILLENGGVYVVANLRGGSEYGEEWHKDGMLFKKQNVFNDFIAAAEHLFAKGYREVTLLGQNVDSYKWSPNSDLKGKAQIERAKPEWFGMTPPVHVSSL